ncbi:MAG: DinB family protein [Bacteroidetes bacterium]|nr:DinB family protein [Bacteroidota bacterium]
MKKSDLSWAPGYFNTYINKVPDVELTEAFAQSISELHNLDMAKLRSLGDQVYAPGKWTVRDIIQHLSDCERVFAYRALRFARNDKTPMPSFDENLFAETAGANTRPLEQVLEELKLVRASTIALFDTFSDESLLRTGVMAGMELPVLALGFTLAGHQIHHFDILVERYFPLLNA